MLKLLICLNILQKSWRICCKIFIVCLTILGHYVLDMPNMKMLQRKIYQMIWQKDLLKSVPEKRCFISLTTLTKKGFHGKRFDDFSQSLKKYESKGNFYIWQMLLLKFKIGFRDYFGVWNPFKTIFNFI